MFFVEINVIFVSKIKTITKISKMRFFFFYSKTIAYEHVFSRNPDFPRNPGWHGFLHIGNFLRSVKTNFKEIPKSATENRIHQKHVQQTNK